MIKGYITAGIVTYNPDIDRLKKNIESIILQVRKIIIVDNASSNKAELIKLLKTYDNICLISNNLNEGIAKALNQICNEAINSGSEWCLLLDQDSVCSDNIIQEYSKFFAVNGVGMLCPYIVDEYKITLSMYKNMDLSETSTCKYAITSGSLVDLSIWKQIGGFLEYFFIDGVDAEYSYNLREHGYKILRANKCYIMHQQGNNTEKTHIYRIHVDESGRRTIKPAFRFNYSLLRWYYMARNNLILIKKYKQLNGTFKPMLSYFMRFFSVVLLERNKISVFKSIYKGFSDGVKYKVN